MKHLLLLGVTLAAFHFGLSDIPEFCRLPAEMGQGNSFIYSFHFDVAKDQCSPFIYKGQGGNDNRFEKERDCIRNCSTNSEMIYPLNERDACHFPKAAGECSGSFLRFYYDSVHDKCKKFHFSGCIGNGNRFFDYTSCNDTCAGVHDDRDEVEEEEPDTPIGIICGVLLGFIVSVILILVVVFIVQSKKDSPKNKKAGGKSKDQQTEEPLQEQAIEMS